MPRITVLLLGACLASCSFGLSRPQFDREPKWKPTCSSSRLAPGIDTAAAVIFLFPGPLLLLANSSESNPNAKDVFGAIGAVFTLVDIGYALAAVYGYSVTGHCRQLKAEWQARLVPARAGSVPMVAPNPCTRERVALVETKRELAELLRAHRAAHDQAEKTRLKNEARRINASIVAIKGALEYCERGGR